MWWCVDLWMTLVTVYNVVVCRSMLSFLNPQSTNLSHVFCVCYQSKVALAMTLTAADFSKVYCGLMSGHNIIVSFNDSLF